MWWFNRTATAWGRTNNRWCCCYCFYSLTQPIPTNPFLWLLWGKRGGEEGCLVLGFLLGSCWVSFRASYAVFSSWNSLLRILRHFRLIQSLNSMEVLILLLSDSLFLWLLVRFSTVFGFGCRSEKWVVIATSSNPLEWLKSGQCQMVSEPSVKKFPFQIART